MASRAVASGSAGLRARAQALVEVSVDRAAVFLGFDLTRSGGVAVPTTGEEPLERAFELRHALNPGVEVGLQVVDSAAGGHAVELLVDVAGRFSTLGINRSSSIWPVVSWRWMRSASGPSSPIGPTVGVVGWRRAHRRLSGSPQLQATRDLTGSDTEIRISP